VAQKYVFNLIKWHFVLKGTFCIFFIGMSFLHVSFCGVSFSSYTTVLQAQLNNLQCARCTLLGTNHSGYAYKFAMTLSNVL